MSCYLLCVAYYLLIIIFVKSSTNMTDVIRFQKNVLFIETTCFHKCYNVNNASNAEHVISIKIANFSGVCCSCYIAENCLHVRISRGVLEIVSIFYWTG